MSLVVSIDPSDALRTAAALRKAGTDERLEAGIEPVPGWQPARVDPARLVAAAPGVTVDPRWRIVAFQWYSGGNGHGAVFAVPAGQHAPEPRFHDAGGIERPAGSLPSVSPALRPDGEAGALPWLARSLLIRELDDLGASWHGIDWGTYELLVGAADLPIDGGPWAWEAPVPRSFDPRVDMSMPGRIVVKYVTRCDVGQARLLEHQDSHYMRDGLVGQQTRVLARGSFGWVP